MSDVQFYTETTIEQHPAHPGVDCVVTRLFEAVGGGEALFDGLRSISVPIRGGDEAGARALAAIELRKRWSEWTDSGWTQSSAVPSDGRN